MTQGTGAFRGFAEGFSDYLPTLAAGLLIAALGVASGWLAKRLIVRILTWLRLDRLAGRVGWRAAVGKADVRAALYAMLGNVVWVIVFLIFLDNALQTLRLVVLAQLVDRAVFIFLPNLAMAAIIVGIGLVLANALSERVEDALEEEEFQRARLVAKLLKGVLLSIVGALGLWQLGFAREIVLTGFLIAFGAIGIAFAVAVGIGSAPAIRRGWEGLFSKKRE